MERNTLFWFALVWSCIIGIACLLDGSSIPQTSTLNIPHKDKIAHFTFYFVFSILWFFYLDKLKDKKSRIVKALYVFVIASIMGGVVEVLQLKFTTSRSAEWMDVVANSSGSLIGLLLCLLITQIKNDKKDCL